MVKKILALVITTLVLTSTLVSAETVVQMTERVSNLSGMQSEPGVEYFGTALTGASSSAVEVPNWGCTTPSMTVILIAGAGTGKMQVTNSTKAAVIAGSAVWRDWAAGVVTGTVEATLVTPVQFIKCVSAAGGMTFQLQK